MVIAVIVAAVLAIGGVGISAKKEHVVRNDTTYQDTVQFEEAAAAQALADTRQIIAKHPDWQETADNDVVPAASEQEDKNTAPGTYY